MTANPFRIEIDYKEIDARFAGGDLQLPPEAIKFKTAIIHPKEFYYVNSCYPQANTAVVQLGRAEDFLEYILFGYERVRIYADDALQWSGFITNFERQGSPDKGSELAFGATDFSNVLMNSNPPPTKVGNKNIVDLAMELIKPYCPDFLEGLVTDNGPSFIATTTIPSKLVPTNEYDWSTTPPTPKFKTIPSRKVKKTYEALKYPLKDKYVDTTQSIWAILMKHCRKLGLTMWITSDNYLFIGRPDYENDEDKFFLDGGKDKNDGNILSSKFSFISAERYSEYLTLAQGRGNRKQKGKVVSGQSKTITDASFRWYFKAQQPSETEGVYLTKRKTTKIGGKDVDKYQLQRENRRQLEEDIIKSIQYSITVDGYKTYDGYIWANDSLVGVCDLINYLEGQYYIISRSVHVNEQDGIKTTLDLIPKQVWLYADDKLSDKEYLSAVESNIGLFSFGMDPMRIESLRIK